MPSITAFLPIGIRPDLGSSWLGFVSSKDDPYQNETFQPLNELLNANMSSFNKGPIIFSAPWLPDIEKQIRDSTSSSDSINNENDGSEIAEPIFQAAIGFFQVISNLFNNEPYIYSSRKGDLIAEFEIPGANMTSIIGSSFILLFKEKNGKIIEGSIDFKDIYSNLDRNKIRNQVSEFLAA